MTTENLFLQSQHPTSRRHAILDDDGTTGWLYLTAPDSLQPIADVWIYNRTTPPESTTQTDHSRPPPLISSLAAPGAVIPNPHDSTWSFRWSPDGHSVLLVRNHQPVALLQSTHKRGHSLALLSPCPWGSPLTPPVLDITNSW